MGRLSQSSTMHKMEDTEKKQAGDAGSYERLVKAAEGFVGRKIQGPAELGRLLGYSTQRVANWEARGGVSLEGAVEAERRFGAHATWVLWGATPAARQAKDTSDSEAVIADIVRRLRELEASDPARHSMALRLAELAVFVAPVEAEEKAKFVAAVAQLLLATT
jgi:hypothetical protein